MLIANLYNEMFARGLTESMRSWSEDWAGRSHNFASTNWSKDVPPETLVRIRARLIASGYPDLGATLLLALIGDLPTSALASERHEVWYAA